MFLKKSKKFNIRNSKSGFSLIEVMIATFIFALIMVAVSMTFASLFGGYKGAKTIQKDLENAQYAMNLMAKSLRTSSVVSTGGNQTSIRFYNYSENKCIAYKLTSSAIQIASLVDPDPESTVVERKDWCTGASFGSYSNLTSANISSVSFYVIPSSSSVVGKVTISMEVCSDSACKNSARIQSTVSLRDYSETMP